MGTGMERKEYLRRELLMGAGQDAKEYLHEEMAENMSARDNFRRDPVSSVNMSLPGQEMLLPGEGNTLEKRRKFLIARCLFYP